VIVVKRKWDCYRWAWWGWIENKIQEKKANKMKC